MTYENIIRSFPSAHIFGLNRNIYTKINIVNVLMVNNHENLTNCQAGWGILQFSRELYGFSYRIWYYDNLGLHAT